MKKIMIAGALLIASSLTMNVFSAKAETRYPVQQTNPNDAKVRKERADRDARAARDARAVRSTRADQQRRDDRASRDARATRAARQARAAKPQPPQQ
jgi:hypothetical protein